MKLIVVLLFSFISCVSATASAPGGNEPDRGSLKGTVTDKNTHEKLTGAVIYIPDLKRTVNTDTNGVYIINNLPVGHFLVEVRLLGYTAQSQMVTVEGDTKLDITLESTEIELQQVVISGVSHATEIKRSPIPITTVEGTYLKQNLGTNAVDAIAKIPGINAVTTGPNVSKPFIRGLGYNRILTLYDGVRIEGQQWGDEHGIEIDQYSIDRVEIIKGPASLTYGSDALAGVVNFLPPSPMPEGKIKGELLTEYQTNNGMYAGSGILAGNTKGYSYMARLSHKQATNYQDKIDGRVYGTAFNETDLNAAFGINKSWGYSHFNFSVYDNSQEIPDGSRDSASRRFTRQVTEADSSRPIVTDEELRSYKITPLHQRVQHYRIFTGNSVQLGKGRLGFSLGYQQSIRREFSHPEVADVAGLYLQLQSLTYDVKYYLPAFKGWEPTVGVNGMYQHNKNNGTEFIIPDYYLFDLGPFAYVKKTYRRLDVSGGLRYDSRSFTNEAMYLKTDAATGFDHMVSGSDTIGANKPFSAYHYTFTGASGSIGATYTLKKNVWLKANIARGFRAPNIAEISANGVHPGTGIYQLGNAAFKPEQNIQEDIGLFLSTRHVSFSIEAFNNDISNYIYNQKILNSKGGDSVIVPNNQTFQYQAGHARLYGGEINIDIHPHPFDWLHFENSISLVYGVNEGVNGKQAADSAHYLPFIPPLHTRHELRASFPNGFFFARMLRNTFIKAELEYYAPQDRAYLAYHTETPTPGYALLNAGLGFDVDSRKSVTLFSISVLCNNLTNVAYQSHLNRLKYFEPYPNDPRPYHGIYNMGRNISLKLVIPVNVK